MKKGLHFLFLKKGLHFMLRDSYDIIFLVKFNVEFPRQAMDLPIKSFQEFFTIQVYTCAKDI